MHQAPPAALTGAWTLVAAFIEPPGAARFDYLGPDPRGRLILDPSGWMIALLTANERSGDAAALLGSMMAYTGRYTADAASFTTHVDAAWVPDWVGTDQRRTYALDGDRLTIRTAPGPHPAFGVEVIGILKWVRAG